VKKTERKVTHLDNELEKSNEPTYWMQTDAGELTSSKKNQRSDPVPAGVCNCELCCRHNTLTTTKKVLQSMEAFVCDTECSSDRNFLDDIFDMDFTDLQSTSFLTCSALETGTHPRQLPAGGLGEWRNDDTCAMAKIAAAVSSDHIASNDARPESDNESPPTQKAKRQKRRPSQRVNVSRKNPTKTALYAFPTFDKCDSLLYLTHSLARHLNTGDFLSLYKLLTTHLDTNCHILAHDMTQGLTVRALTKLFRVMDDVHPDRIVCVSETKVVNNQILSSAHMKFTDSKAIFDSVTKRVKDPVLKSIFKENRGDHLRKKILMNHRPEQEKELFRELVASQQDLLVHKRVDFTITFDDVRKKVTRFVLSGEMMSMERAPHQHACT